MGSPFKSLGGGVKWGAINAVSLIISKLLRGAVIPKLLDPANYGLFASIGLFARYLQFSDFGSSAYLIKQLPHYHFNKSEQERQRLIDTTYTLVVFSFVTVFVYLGGAASLYKGASADFYTLALFLLIPITILSKIKEFFMNYSVAIQDYGNGARFLIGNNYASIVLVVAGIYFYGALGGIAGMLATEIIMLLYVYRTVRLKVAIIWSREIFSQWKQIVKQFLVSVTDVVVATVDQIFILQVFDMASLGFYTLGLSFSWVLESVSEIFNTASYPKLMATARTDKSAAVELINQTMLCFLLTSMLGLPLALVMIEGVVAYYFSEYNKGLEVYSIMLALGVLRGATSLIRRGYIALDMERQYIIYTAATVGTYAAVLSASILLKLSFQQVVVAIVLLNIFTFVVQYTLLVRKNSTFFLENIVILLASSIFLAIYQFVIRNDFGVTARLDGGLAFIGATFLATAAYVYRARDVFRNYVR